MPFTPVKGKFAKISIAGSPDIVLPAQNWSLPIDSNKQDVSNFRDGRKVMTTLDDAELTFTLVLDEDKPPTAAANGNLRNGTEITIKCFTNNAATTFFSAPCMVTRIEPSNEGPTGRVLYNVTASLNGDITYPV
jgi:hypothetical protein